MKKLVLLAGILVCLTAANIVFGQAAQGIITYESKINMHRRIPPEREAMKAMIPEYRTTKFQLFFKESESMYKTVIEDDESEMSGAGSPHGGRVVMRAPNTEVYMSSTDNMITSKQEFMGKEYLIEDSVKVSPWKFGTETKVIQGYECKQAYYTDEVQLNVNGVAQVQKQEITAWYTDKIKPFLGPERYFTLPGTVLAIDVNNGERVIVAQKIELRELKKNELKKPTSGIKTTQEEYRKTVDEQLKKMGASGGFVIRN